MHDVAWYLRRAVPWVPVLGGLAMAGLLVVLSHRWESMTGLALPLVALLAAASAGFVFDEPAVAVTSVAPRGLRWAGVGRLASGLLPLVLGGALLAAAPGETDAGGWALVLAGLGGMVLLVALTGSLCELPRPGSAIASVVVLLGLAPLVVSVFVDVRPPYPLPSLPEGLAAFWGAAAVVGLFGCAAHVAAGRGIPCDGTPTRQGR